MKKSFQNFGEYLYYAYANLQMLHQVDQGTVL